MLSDVSRCSSFTAPHPITKGEYHEAFTQLPDIVLLLILAISCSSLSSGSPDTTGGDSFVTAESPVQPADTNQSFSVEFISFWTYEEEANEAGLPLHFTMDPEGNLVFVDLGINAQNPQVLKLDPNGQIITRWGGLGDGEGKFSSVTNVAAEGQGNIYATAVFNFPIQKFDKDGNFLASFGMFGEGEGLFS